MLAILRLPARCHCEQARLPFPRDLPRACAVSIHLARVPRPCCFVACPPPILRAMRAPMHGDLPELALALSTSQQPRNPLACMKPHPCAPHWSLYPCGASSTCHSTCAFHQTLCRNADYELPFFKKQAAKQQQQLGDLERRKAEALKSAAAAAADFQQARRAVSGFFGGVGQAFACGCHSS